MQLYSVLTLLMTSILVPLSVLGKGLRVEGDQLTSEDSELRRELLVYQPRCYSEEKFLNPMYKGMPLDMCYTCPAQGCGKTAADAYCKKQGYDAHLNYTKLKVTNGQTLQIGGHAVCDSRFHGCETFQQITCHNYGKTFKNPSIGIHSIPLDWCREFEENCGKPAAEAFCKKQGCSLKSYSKRKVQQGTTLTIGDSATCTTDYHGCDSFSQITCD